MIMHPDKSSRVNVLDMKALLLKKIGPERFKRYFYSLDRFINAKMSKVEFDRTCIRVLGKENLLLHNHIIKSILKNACTAKLPPQTNHAGPTNAAAMVDTLVAPAWTNGPMSTPKPRPGVRGPKLKERPSPLGLPNGTVNGVEQPVLNFSKLPLMAPLGIPFCSASGGGVRKPSPLINSFASSYDSGQLSDSAGLRKRMEQIAAACGIPSGVTMECANSLNNMLDIYLKRLIKSSVQLVGIMEEQRSNQNLISLNDFKAAMGLNPQQLGEDWPLLMEKISMQASQTSD